MIKDKIPIWFWCTSVVVVIMLVYNLFQVDSRINMLALGILNIANAIRMWKKYRNSAIIFLIIGVLCAVLFFKYLFQ
ncbi:lipid-A-disaccharide synthase-like uncharacterized protein [Paenibacillus sp. DS2363]|nr:hypothetical protein C170_09555 [Paenibacillus sp. FSL H7-689]OMF08120.1 hypothetical protein BK129_10145 [Paenibacillus amylolyticus]